MKVKILLVAFVAIVIVVFGGCMGYGELIETDTRISWGVDKSPITGRYYEIRYDDGYRFNGMSEITEEEYNKYFEMIEDK
jgi:hypothetical protein